MSTHTTIFSPLWPTMLTNRRLRSGKTVFSSEVGREKHCPRCDEYWPADSEFFYTVPSKLDGLNDWCKACYRENRRGLPAYKYVKECH